MSSRSSETAAGLMPACRKRDRETFSRSATLTQSHLDGLGQGGRGGAREVEVELVGGLAAQQQGLPDRFHHGGGVHRDGHGNPGGAADLVVAADEDVEHDAVDAVVFAVVGDGAHGGGALAEPVDPAFALLVAGRIPGQVVVHDGSEPVLEVDAFGEAVGGDQQPRPVVVGEAGRRAVPALRAAGCRSPPRRAGPDSFWSARR